MGQEVPRAYVDAALQAAADRGCDVADVPVAAIAEAAGVSRSTLLRRLGGTRTALDVAVRESGVDPGGRPRVRERATTAAAFLLDEGNLGALTMEAVAVRADCSVESLYLTFGSRDQLLRATFEQYSPLTELEAFFAMPQADPAVTVPALYRTIGTAFSRPPRIMPALYSEFLSNPDSSAVRAVATMGAPRIIAALGGWLAAQVSAGTIRGMPPVVLLSQLATPMIVFAVVRPRIAAMDELLVPDLETAADLYAENFLRAVGTDAYLATLRGSVGG